MSAPPSNLYHDLPHELPREQFDLLIEHEGVRIERILSRGHTSPDKGWYDQPWDEWVLLLRGQARILFEGDREETSLQPGDHLLIPTHKRHRVTWTDPKEITIWLAVHLKPNPVSRGNARRLSDLGSKEKDLKTPRRRM